MLTEDCIRYLLELMNLPGLLGEDDYMWFSSDWQGEDRSVSERFRDMFLSWHLSADEREDDIWT